MAKPTCQNCGKPVLPGSKFCSNSCDAGSVMNRKGPRPSPPSRSVGEATRKGAISITLTAIEFDKPVRGRGPSGSHRATLWEGRVSTGGNGDCVARRVDPDEALTDALRCFMERGTKRAPEPEEDEDDVTHLV